MNVQANLNLHWAHIYEGAFLFFFFFFFDAASSFMSILMKLIQQTRILGLCYVLFISEIRPILFIRAHLFNTNDVVS